MGLKWGNKNNSPRRQTGDYLRSNKLPSNIDVKNTIIPVVADGAAVLVQRFLDTHHYNINKTRVCLACLCTKSPCAVKQTFVFPDRYRGTRWK